MNDTQARPLSTQERLVAATWQIIRDEGLRAATSRRISAEAGANLGAITYYFGSKDQLIARAATERMSDWIAPMGTSLLADADDGGSRTATVIDSLLALLAPQAADARALLEVVAAPELATVRTLLAEQLGQFQTLVAQVITAQQQRGEVPDSAHPTAAAGLFSAIALGLLFQEALEAHPVPVNEIVIELLAILANAAQAH